MTTTSATTSTGPKGFRWLYLILGIVLFVFGVGIIRHPVASYFDWPCISVSLSLLSESVKS